MVETLTSQNDNVQPTSNDEALQQLQNIDLYDDAHIDVTRKVPRLADMKAQVAKAKSQPEQES